MTESFDRLLQIEREMKAQSITPFDNGMYCLFTNKETLASLIPMSKLQEWLTEEFEYSDIDRQSISEAQSTLLLTQGFTKFVAFVGNLMLFTKD